MISATEPRSRREAREGIGSRPPKAVVGSQVSHEEEIFGKVYDAGIVGRLWAFAEPYRGRIFLAVAAVLAFTGTQLAIPLLIRYAIDHGMAVGDTNRTMLTVIALIFAFIALINYGASWLQEMVIGVAAEGVLSDLRRAMFSHLQRVSLGFMDKTEAGRLMSRLQGDVNSMQEFMETTVFSVGDIVLLVGIVVVLLWLDWRLGLMTLAVMPALFVVRLFWMPLARDSFIEVRETNSIANGAMAEGIHGVRTVQAMGRQDVNYALYDDKAYDNLVANLRASRYAQIMVPAVDTLTGIAMAVVIVVGGSLVLNKSLDLGVMVAFLFYIQRFFDPIRSLTLQYSVMQRAMASGERILEVLDVPVSIEDKPDAVELSPDMDGSVEFKNVTFGYVPGQPILKNVSFKVNPGETVALVGPTGSGKTSSTALVHRFYDVWEGQVLVGGKDVRDVTQASLGREVSMVLQEPFLFTGSVIENIRYARIEATREEVVRAAEAVGAHEFIMRLPQGYETKLEQRGANLSLGQRQLISFARAIVADSKILVLDEATASIDSYTEMLIQKALAKLLEGRTGIVIAHRLATIRGADRIVVLQNGSVIEEGNHEALMAKKGLYYRLYSLNYASFDDIPDDLVAEATAQAGAT
ncbi:MAG TPA: ABC transporter ATP-binding protein [Devosia sp.]|nr:ABC transporter ATP-binding protein [Devosia sp.]